MSEVQSYYISDIVSNVRLYQNYLQIAYTSELKLRHNLNNNPKNE